MFLDGGREPTVVMVVVGEGCLALQPVCRALATALTCITVFKTDRRSHILG